MKEVKAFVPASRAADVLEALKQMEEQGAGILNLAAFPVQMLPHGSASGARYSVELAEGVASMVKVEALCEAGEVLRLSELIKREVGAGVGERGWIIVTGTSRVEPLGEMLGG
jgi:hypothetical protein